MEHQIQQTLQPNSWLSDPEFIKQIKYEDKEYLSSLFDIFKKSFIFICPVKITAEYDLTRNRIAILTRTGIAGYLDVDRTVNPYDFCVLAKNLVYSQYPSYHVKYTQEIQTPRDPAEIIEVMEKDSGAKLEEIMHKSIPQVVEEAGVIEKVYMKDDQFRIVVNGVPQIRHCKMPVSYFLSDLRHLSKKTSPDIDIKKKEFIDSNSRILHEVHFYTEKKELNIPAYQYKNFFRINFPSLCKHDLIFNTATNKYEWERYIIDFPTVKLKEECIQLLNELRAQEGSNG